MHRAKTDAPEHFSRAANSALQRFNILKDTDNILSGRLRKIQPFDGANMVGVTQQPKATLTEGEVCELIRGESQKLLLQKEAQQLNKQVESAKSPLFASQSREEWYRTKVSTRQANKDNIPPCGWYDVNYALLDK
jgi:hypothetical protein